MKVKFILIILITLNFNFTISQTNPKYSELLNETFTAFASGNKSKAIKLAQSIISSNGSTLKYEIGFAYQILGELSSDLILKREFLKSSIKYLQEMPELNQTIASNLFSLGNTYSCNDKEHYQYVTEGIKLIKLSKFHEDSLNTSIYLTNLAYCEQDNSNYEQAISLTKEAVTYVPLSTPNYNSNYSLADLYKYLSMLYLLINNSDSSQYYLKFAINQTQILSSKIYFSENEKIKSYKLMADIYNIANDNQCIDYYNKLISIYYKNKYEKGNYLNISNIYLNIANYMMKESRWIESINYSTLSNYNLNQLKYHNSNDSINQYFNFSNISVALTWLKQYQSAIINALYSINYIPSIYDGEVFVNRSHHLSQVYSVLSMLYDKTGDKFNSDLYHKLSKNTNDK